MSRWGVFFLCLCTLTPLHAKKNIDQRVNTRNTNEVTLGAEASTTQKLPYQINAVAMLNDFSFSSQNGTSFNRYVGESRFAAFTFNNYDIHGFFAGISLYNIDTDLSSATRLSPLTTSNNESRTHSTGLYLHAMKPFKRYFYFDMFGGISQSSVQLISSVINTGFTNQFGKAHYSPKNDFYGARVHAFYPYEKWSFQGELSVLASWYRTPDYVIDYNPTPTTSFSITTTVVSSSENLRVFYQWTDELYPFAHFGLIQVPYHSTDRPILPFTPVAPLPSLTLEEGGFSFGGGLVYRTSFLRVSTLYRHTKRGSEFRSDTILVSLDLTLNDTGKA